MPITSTLARALKAQGPSSLDPSAHGIEEVLKAVATDGHSFQIRAQGANANVLVELGNGFVMGATAEVETDGDKEQLEGPAAYALLLELMIEAIVLERRRFLSMANLLKPVTELVDEARNPFEMNVPETIDVILPRLGEDEAVTMPRSTRRVGAITLGTLHTLVGEEINPGPIVDELVLRAQEAAERSRQNRTKHILRRAGALTGLLVGFALAFGVVRAAQQNQAPGIPVSAGPEVIVEEEQAMEAGAEVDAPSPSVLARQLARQALEELREGQREQALSSARAAVRLRGHLPYYQVLLGDALAQNGRPAAARRAWRRALRQRHDYGPALDRLSRRARRAGTSTQES